MLSLICGASLKEAGLKHHLFGVEADALVGFGVVVVAPNWVGVVVPAPRHLEVVAWDAFMRPDHEWAHVHSSDY